MKEFTIWFNGRFTIEAKNYNDVMDKAYEELKSMLPNGISFDFNIEQ